jgi:Leucine-rich repeat (LRR) protein
VLSPYLKSNFLAAISFIPANIGKLSNLETLELRENYLENLPTTIKLLQKLKLLDMGRNNFENLPTGEKQHL